MSSESLLYRRVTQLRGLRQKYYEKKSEAGPGKAIYLRGGKNRKKNKAKDKVMFPGLKFWIFILINLILFNNLYMIDIESCWQFIWSLLGLLHGSKQLREKLIGHVNSSKFIIGKMSDFCLSHRGYRSLFSLLAWIMAMNNFSRKIWSVSHSFLKQICLKSLKSQVNYSRFASSDI